MSCYLISAVDYHYTSMRSDEYSIGISLIPVTHNIFISAQLNRLYSSFQYSLIVLP